MRTLAAIHVAKTKLGLDEETYRALLKRVTGKVSAGDMSETERRRVVEEMRRQGFAAAKGLEGPFAGKLRALWIAAWNLGLVRDRRDAALLAFVKRQTGISHTRFLRDPADARRAIEALKRWMAREAKVDWTDGDHKPAWQRLPGAKIALAQWIILHPGPRRDSDLAGFRQFVEERAFNPLARLTAREWAGVMNTLGRRIRAIRR